MLEVDELARRVVVRLAGSVAIGLGVGHCDEVVDQMWIGVQWGGARVEWRNERSTHGIETEATDKNSIQSYRPQFSN